MHFLLVRWRARSLLPSARERESAERARSSALGDGSMREREVRKKGKRRDGERELESERETILLCSLSLVHQILNEEAIKLRMKDCKIRR